jgi:glycosyltransferase involved in cell wall biosynthesis
MQVSTRILFTTPKKIVCVSIINDLVTDHRVYKTCLCLQEMGYNVKLIGRKLPNSLPIPTNWTHETQRMKLLFKTGPAFYFFFTWRLFFKLLFTKNDVLFANDLDTLLPNYLVSKLKNIPLIYDSHEVFCEVPELLETPLKKRIWEKLESRLVPKLKYCITVNQSIKHYFEKKYKVPFVVVRNIPLTPDGFNLKSKQELQLPLDKKIIILQGAGLNINRGVEELIEAMKHLDNVYLLIIGSGDIWHNLPELISQFNVSEKVRLVQKIPKHQLMAYTQASDLGISIDKATNLNYQWSLPNKIFDYIHAELPIVASKLTEIETIISTYNIGAFIESHEPKHIASVIELALNSSDYSLWKQHLKLAKMELKWEFEVEHLKQLIKSIQKK